MKIKKKSLNISLSKFWASTPPAPYLLPFADLPKGLFPYFQLKTNAVDIQNMSEVSFIVIYFI